MVLVLLLSFLSGTLRRSNPGIYGGILARDVRAGRAVGLRRRLDVVAGQEGCGARSSAATSTQGLGWYSVMRAFQMRRTRVPRATVKRGEFPG